MNLSKPELRVLEQIASGNTKITEIAHAIKKSDKQIYRTSKNLIEKGFIEVSRGIITAKKTTHNAFLLNLLSQHPNLIKVLSGNGIKILVAILSPKNIKQIAKEINLKKSVIYQKMKQFYNMSIVRKEKKNYVLNIKVWDKLKEFLEEYNKFLETIDKKIPANSIIYKKTDKELVFANKSKINATLTAFSCFENFGIKIFLTTNYYTLPKRKLSKKIIFMHSLYIAEKEKTVRYLIFVSLFYLKFKKELLVKHPIIDRLNLVLKGNKFSNYPTLQEIKEKADMYDIRI